MGTEAITDGELVRLLSSLGVGGAIAGILFYFYRKDIRSYTELWREATIAARAETAVVVQALNNVTAAITLNTEVVRAMHRRMDMDTARRHGFPPPSDEDTRL